MSAVERPAHGSDVVRDRGMRPEVAVAPSRMPVAIFIVGALIAAVLLFNALDARRRALTAPPTRPVSSDLLLSPQAAPSLFIPPADETPAYERVLPRLLRTQAPQAVAPPQTYFPPPSPAPRQQTQPDFQNYAPPIGPTNLLPEPPMRVSSSPVMVFGDGGTAGPRGGDSGSAADGQGAGRARGNVFDRARAGPLQNPASTVPQGTLIPGVLETALDSTRAGQARALVSRDVRGFDGTTILIPRGSRLYGDYQADVKPGQNRALIQWTRLVRPDGATIALDSPSADPLGRAGVKGKVDSHFFARFGGAILQSVLNIGTNVAARSISDGSVIVALPGSAGAAVGGGLSQDIPPTLKVKPGARVSVFVARDLDFTAVKGRQ